jgi:hypothetical protein
VLYYGVLAPRARDRARVVAWAGSPHADPSEPHERDESSARRAGGYLWAQLMRRAFGFDVLACPRCGGRLRLLALIQHRTAVERILRHLGLPTERPEPWPPEPRHRLEPTGPVASGPRTCTRSTRRFDAVPPRVYGPIGRASSHRVFTGDVSSPRRVRIGRRRLIRAVAEGEQGLRTAIMLRTGREDVLIPAIVSIAPARSSSMAIERRGRTRSNFEACRRGPTT